MNRFQYLLPIVALTAVLAACGGGGGSSAKLASADVAVVGSTHVTNADFQVYADAQQSINLRILERFRTLEVTFQAVAPTQVQVRQPPGPVEAGRQARLL